jgi:hypothetical protein
MHVLELGRVNRLDIQVLYDRDAGLFTMRPSFGQIGREELSARYCAGIFDFANMAKVKIDLILRHFGLGVKNPEIVPREDPSSTVAEYTFSIEERQVPCV